MTNKAKILYVDDEMLNVQVFQITFSQKYNVIKAISGAEGLEMIKKNPDIQFVVSDMRMPGMNGLEFIKEVKKINNAVSCMILSGYQETREIMDALKNEIIVEYMMKPFNKTEIEQLISRYTG